MQTEYVLLILSLALILVFMVVLIVWMLFRNTGISASTDVKTRRVVQKLYSHDVQRRALIIENGNGRYQVVRSHYSDEIINSISGEVVGWRTLKDKPVVGSMFEAVTIAEEWLQEKA